MPFFVGGWVRLSRERVCTALTPPSFLSTYIVCSSGWSNPVWNLLATIRKRYSAPLEGLGGLRLREAVHARLGVGLAAVVDACRRTRRGP